MGRKAKESHCRKFFIYDDINNLNFCKVPKCKVVMRGNHSANLERHIQRFHQEEYLRVQADKGHEVGEKPKVDGKMGEEEGSSDGSPNKSEPPADVDCEAWTSKVGRRRTNPCRKFFYFDHASYINICNIAGCGTIMKGDHAANLERHLQRHHPEEFSEIAAMKRTKNPDDFFEGGPNTLVQDGDTSQGKEGTETVVKKPKIRDENGPKMGRRRTNPCRKYYQYNPDNNTNACIIPGCTIIMKGDHASNLERHLHSRHIEEYCEIQEEKKLNTVLKEDGMEYYNDVMQDIMSGDTSADLEKIKEDDILLKTARGRKSNPTREFFEYDKRTNTNMCRMEGCGALMKGDHAANLERHLQSHHIEQYCVVQRTKQQRQEVLLLTKKHFLARHNQGSDAEAGEDNDDDDEGNDDDDGADSDSVPDHPHRERVGPEYLDDNIVEINCEKKRRGRPRTDPCRRFFVYDGATNTSHCRAEKCSAVLEGNCATSMRRHLHSQHSQQYSCFQMLLTRLAKQSKRKRKDPASSDNEAPACNYESDRDTGSDMEVGQLEESAGNPDSQEDGDLHASSNSKGVSKRGAEDSNSGNEAKRFCSDTGLDEDDELEIFGQYVVGQLKRLSGEDVWNTQEKIRSILRESCKKPALDKRK